MNRSNLRDLCVNGVVNPELKRKQELYLKKGKPVELIKTIF